MAVIVCTVGYAEYQLIGRYTVGHATVCVMLMCVSEVGWQSIFVLKKAQNWKKFSTRTFYFNINFTLPSKSRFPKVRAVIFGLKL
jgi:hypothetical protein